MGTAFSVSTYLGRIGYQGKAPEVSAASLARLHQLHLFNVPFENLDIHMGREITLNIDSIFAKIAGSRRGGFCYELNNLFHHLLANLDFSVHFISCMVYRPDADNFAADFGHVANVVTIGEERWLADVGFGDGFIRPLRIEFETPQEQRGVIYILEKRDDGVYLKKSADGREFVCMYKFSLAPRKIEAFKEMCVFHQRSPLSPFTQRKICTLPNPEGRITLTQNSLVTTKNGVRESRELSGDQEFGQLLETIFGITLQALPG